MKITVNYVLDKITTGAYRFMPEDDRQIGKNAFIYLKKDVCEQQGIDPQAGFAMTIEQ